MTTKDTSRGDGTSQEVTNTYNLQGRLETVTTKEYDATPDLISTSEATYTYNPQGIRVSKDVDDTITDYLIDPYNHTGHAQVIEETTDDGIDLTRIQYTIGDDVISQAESTWNGVDTWDAADTQYLLYDGHGSTRQLANSSGTVIDGQNYSYDGYGVMLSDSTASGADVAAAADTSLLYAGEQYDSSASMYYNRARYYNPSNGLFNRVDPYSGNRYDPQSLHKYAYCHNNPINAIDPTGMFIGGITDLVNSITIRGMLIGMEYGPKIAAGLLVAIKITAAMWLAALTILVMQKLGVIPQDEYVAEIAAILGYVLILELMVFSMLPASWKYPATPSQQASDSRPRGMQDPRVKKAVDVGIKVHYDRLTDPSKYKHEGGPLQLQRIYNKGTKFQFARRGQKGLDVIWKSGPHPSTYPNSKWPSGINQADFKPDTPTGNAFKLPPNTLRIPYDPKTGQIKH